MNPKLSKENFSYKENKKVFNNFIYLYFSFSIYFLLFIKFSCQKETIRKLNLYSYIDITIKSIGPQSILYQDFIPKP